MFFCECNENINILCHPSKSHDIRSQVCKLLHDVVDGTPRIQYKMELEIAGLTDRPTVKMSVTERISTLSSHQAFFKSLKAGMTAWRTQFDEVVAYHGDLAVVCLLPREDSVGEPISQLEYESLKLCRVLPASMDAGVSPHWWNIKPKRAFTGVWMDPGQDLMVLTCIESVKNETVFAVSSSLKSVLTPLDGSGTLFNRNNSLQVLSISSGERLSDGDISIPLPGGSLRSLRWRVARCCIWDDMVAITLWQLPPFYPRTTLILGWRDGDIRAVGFLISPLKS